MARSSSGGRGGLRTLALVAAVAIALASTAAVVLSDDPETLRLAVVGALWAFVLAAFGAPRRRESDASAGDPGTALELRRTYEIELEKEVAARREYELQLEVYLRRELERGLAEDVAALRDEVGRMRGDMIDRLDGELRMERIETTRLIGGSLRALQDEARRLGIGLPVPPELAADYPPDPIGSGSGHGSGEYGFPGGQADLGAPNGPPGYSSPGGGGESAPPPPAYGGGPPTPVYGGGPPTPAYGAGPPAYGGGPPTPAYGAAGVRRRPPTYGAGPPHPPPHQPAPGPAPPAPSGPAPPVPRAPAGGESVSPRRHRAREDGEDNEVMSRLLGR